MVQTRIGECSARKNLIKMESLDRKVHSNYIMAICAINSHTKHYPQSEMNVFRIPRVDRFLYFFKSVSYSCDLEHTRVRGYSNESVFMNVGSLD